MLFAVLISITISVNGYQNVVENTEGIHLQSPHAEPTIIKTFVNPQKARCGETITVYALIHDATGIERVNAIFFHEAGADTVEMNLLAGTERFGLWSGRWKVHDTLEKEYTVRVNAFSSSGLSSSSEAIWKDPSNHWWNINWRYRKPITVDNPSSQDLYEYQILINLSYSSNMKSDFSDLRFTWYNVTANREEEIPYYIEKKVDGKWALIWVKVTEIKSSSSSTVYVYYGNPAADSASNISATFSYSEPRTIGYIVSDKIVSNGIEIMSLCDNNTIIIGDYTFNLDEQERGSIPPNSVQIGDAVKVKGLAQVEGSGDVDDMIVPVSWAGTKFIYGGMRDNGDRFCMLSPWGDASVKIYDGGTLEWSGTVTSSGVCVTCDITSGHAAKIVSDIPILVCRYGAANRYDAWVFYPATTDYLYGPSVSNDAFVAAGSGGATVSYVVSTGSSNTKTLGADSQLNLVDLGRGSSGSGPAIRIKASSPVGAIQQADHDGTESTVFVPSIEMGTKFGSAIAAEYIVAVTPYPNTVCTVYDSAGNIVETKTGGSRNDVNQIAFGTGSDATYVSGGWKIESNNPIWVYYEADDNGDETNLLGYKQMRQYVWPEPEYTVGAEEVAIPTKPILEEPEDDACISDETPTFRWIAGENADNHTLLVDNQSDFSSPEINVTLGPDATSYTVPAAKALSEGRWYWKVIANNTNGKNESDVRTFICDRTPPPAPNLTSPENNNVTDDKSVTFSWSPVSDDTSKSSDVSGIAYYEIQVSTNQNFTDIVLDDTTTGTSITREVEGRLYWRVRAWDRAGNAGEFSEVRNITVFSFTLSASSTEVQIQRGSSISINISTSVDFGEPEDISLNYSWAGAVTPTQINIAFDPQTISGLTNSSTLTITSESAASTGSFTCRITATSESGIKREIDIKITVYAMLFSLYCYPQEVTLMRSDSERITLSVEFDQGALDTVNLSGEWEGEVPEGVSVNIFTSSGIPPYQTTVLVTTSDSAEKGTFVYRITGEGSGLERILNIYINVLTDLSLEVTTDKETYEKGDRIKIYGSVKDPFGDAVGEGSVKISIFDGEQKHDISASISDGSFSASYYITFDRPEGEWRISVTAKDDKGDTTPHPQNLTISVKSPETCEFLSISVVNPSYGQIFRRGETVTFTAIVTDNGKKVSGASLKGYLPNGDVIAFSEGEPGIYASNYKLGYNCELENWTVYIEGIKDTDGVLKSGFAWITFRVLPAKPIYQIINQLPRKVEAGEEVEIEIKALYPDGTPVEDGVIKATAQDGEEIVFNPIGSGIYVASFTPEEGGTDWLINVTISDSYGNVASLSLGKINVTTPSVSTYAVRYWWATLALSSLTAIAVGTFTHRRLLFIRLKKYRKDIQNLERQKRIAAERYFLKGEITREAYDKIIQECENRIAELSKKCGILEKEIRKLRRVKS